MNERPLNLIRLAERMGRSYGWMSRHWRALRAEQGFPGPIAGFGLLWDPLAVDEWLARQRAGAARPVTVLEPDATAELTDEQWGEILDRRALAMAPAQGRA